MDKAYEHFNSGKYSEASILFEEAIALEPDIRFHYWYLGLCYLLQGQTEEAQMTWWLTITENTQELTVFLHNKAVEFSYKSAQHNIAVQILEAAVELEPQNINLLRDLARIYQFHQKYDLCIEVAKIYLDLAIRLPDQIFANHLILHALLSKGNNWDDIFLLAETQTSLYKAVISTDPSSLSSAEANEILGSTFFLPYVNDKPRNSRTLQNEIANFYQTNIRLNNIDLVEKIEYKHILSGEKTLKIGYISHCLGKKAVGYLARWIFQHHNHDKFTIHTYFLLEKPNVTDYIKEEIAQNSDKSYRLGYDSREIAQRIYEDEIDILVDLDSITLNVTCEVMALKPAPIQVTWLGLDASGIPAIDYFMADRHVLPENAQDYYSEKIWRLPNSYIAVDGFEVLFPTLFRDQIDIPPDAVTFLTAQVGYKRHPHTVCMQMRVIKAVPNSYLLIKGLGDQEGIKRFFIEIAAEEGVSGDRLRFLPMVVGEAEHRANLGIADVVLDTYPYNGATTTMETLWMCIPMVTRVGEQFAARNSYTMMMNAGITEGIAWTDEEYVEWGIRLGTDENLRKQIFWKLKESRKTSPLWNAKQFTRDMETAYQQMWEIYLKSKAV